jgi:hypothetical protein
MSITRRPSCNANETAKNDLTITGAESSAPRKGDWLQHSRAGRFDTIPDSFAWNESIAFAHLLQGYEVAQTLGITTLGDFANAKRRHAESTGGWAGTPLELWLCLFFEHRRARHGGGSDAYAEGAHPLLDALCRELREGLQNLPQEEALLISKMFA